ncbi:MAG: sulfatase-like hydrolase/transferase [Acidobacteriota bacterium]
MAGSAAARARFALAGLIAAVLFASSCRGRESGAGAAAPPKAAAPPRVVVLITIDTLRADSVGFLGNTRGTTPNLDRLAREGLVFEHAHASNVVTLPSHTNILTGLYPYQHGVRDNSGFRLESRIPTAATLLHDAGWATGAFVAAFPLDARYGLDRGFDVYDQRYPPATSAYDFEVQERPAPEVVSAALEWFEREKARSRFLWVHVYEPHAPYLPPAPFAERYRDKPYLGEVAAADAALGPLLERLRSEDALVVVTGDHGEAFGSHGELTHGLFAYEATLHVPLVVWSPSRIAPGRRADPVRHIDVLPTMLESVRVAAPRGLPGLSLLSAPVGASETYFEALSAWKNRGWAPLTGICDDRYKYVDLPIPELYDFKADPEEKTNLFASQATIARRLKAKLTAASAAGASAGTAPDSEEARRLMSLGYLSGSTARKTRYTAADDPKTLVTVDAEIHRVIDLFQHNDVFGATSLARQVLRDRPGMPTGYEFLAFLLQAAGKDREAAQVLADAAKKGLASEDMNVRLALILSEAGRSADALRVLKPLAQSTDPDTQNAIGIALSDSGQSDEALRVFEKILERDARNALALQNAGIALLKKGDAPGAIERFRRAFAINDRLPRAWNARGVAEAQLGRAPEAIASWKRATDLDPRQYDALFNMALVAGKSGDRATAREALSRFVETAPSAVYARDIAAARKMLAVLGGG